MATKDITDRQVCEAYRDAAVMREARGLRLIYPPSDGPVWPTRLLMERTGQPLKVCVRAMERADRRGLVDYGVSLRAGWLTGKGRALLGDGSP